VGYLDPTKKEAQRKKYHYRYHRRKYWVNKIKQGYGCDDCGYNSHPAALDFDHIDPDDKEFLIPRYLARSNLKRLFKEIRKCRVLCANCHRIHSNYQWHEGITYKRKNDV
jgi:hypothetical protein